MSEARQKVNATVTKVQPGTVRKYGLQVQSESSSTCPAYEEYEEFDIVVIAAPFRFNGYLSVGSNIQTSLAPYIERHVTHFA